MRRVTKQYALSAILAPTVFFALFLWSDRCFADEEAEAKVTFEKAVVMFAGEDYKGALEAFSESYRIYPRATTLFNMGMCQKALLLYVEALGTFEEFVADENAAEHPTLSQHAQTAIVDLTKLIGALEITGVPEGARVILDGEELTETSLATPFRLNPGYHSLQVTLPGFEPFVSDVTSTPSATTVVEVRLDPARPEEPPITVETEPATKPPRVEIPREDTPGPMLRISALAAGAVGLGFAAFGVYYGTEYNRLVAEGNADVDYVQNEGPDQGIMTNYYNIEQKALPEMRTRIIWTHTVGWTLVAAGVTMFVIDVKKRKKTEKERRAHLYPGGVSVQF